MGEQTITGLNQIDTDIWEISVAGAPWSTIVTNEALDVGLQGVLVDLDASTVAGPFYRILENGDSWLRISTEGLASPTFLSVGIGSTSLIGIHLFQSLDVVNGAKLYAGEDKVVEATILDSDEDGVYESDDDFPDNPAAGADTDGDGLVDEWLPGYSACQENDLTCNGLLLDLDDDNDSYPDTADAFPLSAVAITDTDSDGKPDSWIESSSCANAEFCDGLELDKDDDNDGLDDTLEADYGTDPLDSDSDDDGYTDGIEYAYAMPQDSGIQNTAIYWLDMPQFSNQTYYDVASFNGKYYLSFSDALNNMGGALLYANSLTTGFQALPDLENLISPNALLPTDQWLYMATSSGTYRLATDGSIEYHARSLESAPGYDLNIVDDLLVQGNDGDPPFNAWEIIGTDESFVNDGYTITDTGLLNAPIYYGQGQTAVRFKDWVYFSGVNSVNVDGSGLTYPAFYGAPDLDLQDGLTNFQRIALVDLSIGELPANQFSVMMESDESRFVMVTTKNSAYSWTRDNSNWNTFFLPKGIKFSDKSRVVNFLGNFYVLAYDTNKNRYVIYQLEKDADEFRAFYELPHEDDIGVDGDFASLYQALTIRKIDETNLAVTGVVTTGQGNVLPYLHIINLNISGIRPPTVSVTQQIPVDVHSALQIKVQYDVSMDYIDEPSVVINAPQGVAPVVLSGGSWVSTVHPRDTYITPSIRLDYSNSGPLQVSVSGGTDIYGNQLVVAGDLYDFYIQSEAPAIISHVASPEINEGNVADISLVGERPAFMSILLNGSEMVEAGEGSFAFPVSLPEGDTQLTVSGIDQWGYETEAVHLDFYTDTAKPGITNIFPADNAVINITIETVNISFTEEGSGIDGATSDITLLRGVSNISGTVAFASNQAIFMPSVPIIDGQYYLQVRLVDQLGNETNWQTQFIVDYTPPALPEIPDMPEVITSNSFEISGTKESGSAVLLNGEVIVSNNDDKTWNYTVTLVEGENTFSIIIRDEAGNESEPVDIIVAYDNTAPSAVMAVANAEGDGTSIILNWSGYNEADNGGDIAVYRIYQSDQPFSDITAADVVEVGAVNQGGAKEYKVTGLTRELETYFAVVAEDQQQQKITQVTSLAVTPIDNQAPEDITGLRIISAKESAEIIFMASENTKQDLAGYRVKVTNPDASEQVTELPVTDVAEMGEISHVISGLQAQTAYPLAISVFDNSGNVSDGVDASVVTWMANPIIDSTESLSEKIRFTLTQPQPLELLQNYQVYVTGTPFTDVSSLSVHSTIAKGSDATLQAAVAGLENDTTYYMAVVAVNINGGFDPVVTSIEVTPQGDKQGPVLSNAFFTTTTSVQLTQNQDITQNGVFEFVAVDESGVSQVQISINGQDKGLATLQENGRYHWPMNLIDYVDGSATMSVRLLDGLANESTVDYTLNISMAAPAAPVLSKPVDNTVTNEPTILVEGSAAPSSLVSILVNGSAVMDVAVSVSGDFTGHIDLQEGSNAISAAAKYEGRTGLGEEAASVSVQLDTSIPDAPGSVSVINLPAGQISISWTTPLFVDGANPVVGYNLYRSSSAFADKADGDVEKVNDALITGTSYKDLLATDGDFYYSVVAVNNLGTESTLSQQVMGIADNTPPFAQEISYTSSGIYDENTHTYGRGSVHVLVTLNEVLRNKPFLAITPDGGVPKTLELTPVFGNERQYEGYFTIDDTTPVGTAYAVFSAHDVVGNKGTGVLSGETLEIDAQGPALQALALNPANPLKVDEQNGLLVEVYATLNEDTLNDAPPMLVPQVNGVAVAGYEQGITLQKDARSSDNAPLWIGSFQLDNSAGVNDQGLEEVELLSFGYQAQDYLQNTSERILSANSFQLYQGDLPPLYAPTGLTAVAQSAGVVHLEWQTVEDAVGYRIFRKAQGDAEFAQIDEVRGASVYDDATDVDGEYTYAVASLREENSQQSQSGYSNLVVVRADSVSPLPAQDLTLELNGAGIVARWAAVTQDVDGAEEASISYEFYRLDLAEGAAITSTDLDGIEPLVVNIPELIALDSRPSDSEHSYTLVAVDSAGNRSEPSAPVYLNAGLLPVSDLHIQLDNNGFPQISWTHNNSSVAGFDIYRGPEGSRIKLNSQLITRSSAQTSYTDYAYNAGHASQGASTESLYTVVAVDANQVESIGHSLLLPALSANLLEATEQPLTIYKGVMNRVRYRVQNAGEQDVSGIKLAVNVLVDGVIKTHSSNTFTITAQSFTDVDVVIGGYNKLDAITIFSSELSQTPQAGESVLIKESEEVFVLDDVLSVNLQPQDFARGASGQVTFSFTNDSDVTTEIVLARNSGNGASDEIHLILEDEDGNVLSNANVQQFTGNVITTTDGRTIARVNPGETFTSEPVTMAVPDVSADTLTLRLVVDTFHYDTGKATEVVIQGNGTSRQINLTETDYYATLTQVSPSTVFGRQPVQLTGTAQARGSDAPMPNSPVKLMMQVNGFQRTFTVFTDNNGDFSYVYVPQTGESGLYQVAAVHPDVLIRPQQETFVVQSASVSPTVHDLRLPRNYSQKMSLQVNTGYATELSNVHVEQVPLEGQDTVILPAGISVQAQPLSQVNAESRAYLNLTFSADNSAPQSGHLRYQVISGESGSDNVLATVQINYWLSEAVPVINATPAYINTGMAREDNVLENMQITNTGFATLENVQLSIQDLQGNTPDWVSLASPSQIADLPVGEKATVTIRFNPDALVDEGNHQFRLLIASSNTDTYSYNLYAAVTQSGIGQAFFHISDIYTATLDENQQPVLGLKGAKIELQNEQVLSETYSMTSDVNGEATFESLPAGTYLYRVSAFDHDSKSGRIWVKPGVTNAEDVFLQNQVITVEWTVNEIVIEDRYEVVLEATYETNVPVAVVVLEPSFTNLPDMKKGDVFQGEMSLTNYGLIKASSMAAHFPGDNEYMDFEFQYDIPTQLHPGEVFYIPYKVTALKDFRGQVDANATGGGSGCSTTASVGVSYSSECANGQNYNGSTSAGFGATTGSCETTSGGGASGGSSSVSVSGGGSSSSSYSPPGTSLGGEEGFWMCVPQDCPNGECD